MQGKLMEACRRIAASLEDGEDGDVEDVLSTVYKTSLFHNYGHGSYFSWSNENASNAIEEFEDLVIGFFDKSLGRSLEHFMCTLLELEGNSFTNICERP